MTLRHSLFALLLSLLLSPPLLAGEDDHDRAREALEAGEILPLRAIIEQLERDYPGQILEVELDRDKEQWVYKIKLLRANGSLVKLKLNAGDGTLLGIKGRDIAPDTHSEGKP
jgi:uncharacterized membrane protein YkoI